MSELREKKVDVIIWKNGIKMEKKEIDIGNNERKGLLGKIGRKKEEEREMKIGEEKEGLMKERKLKRKVRRIERWKMRMVEDILKDWRIMSDEEKRIKLKRRKWEKRIDRKIVRKDWSIFRFKVKRIKSIGKEGILKNDMRGKREGKGFIIKFNENIKIGLIWENCIDYDIYRKK